jgi:hypothetical protein
MTQVASTGAHSPTRAGQLDSHRALDGECDLVAGVDGAVAFGGELETGQGATEKVMARPLAPCWLATSHHHAQDLILRSRIAAGGSTKMGAMV